MFQAVTSRERYDAAKKEEWSSLVEAILSGEHVDCPKWKRSAIRWAKESGCSQEQIINLGQAVILSRYSKERREVNYGPQKMLRWRVSSGLADAIMSATTSPDQPESLVTRLVRVLGIRTSEEFWLFISSTYADLTDAELLHLAGEGSKDAS